MMGLMTLAGQEVLWTESRIQPSIQVIDRFTCSGSTGQGSDCTGLDVYRVVFEDGTTKLMIALQAPASIDLTTSNWKQIPVKLVPTPGLTILPAK